MRARKQNGDGKPVFEMIGEMAETFKGRPSAKKTGRYEAKEWHRDLRQFKRENPDADMEDFIRSNRWEQKKGFLY